MKSKLLALIVAVLGVGHSLSAADLTLWYQQPAADSKPMNEALPIGNGRIGGLIFGGRRVNASTSMRTASGPGMKIPPAITAQWAHIKCSATCSSTCRGHETFAITGATSIWRRGSRTSAIESNGVKFPREYFCSHPAGVLVAEFTADKQAAYTGSIELADSHNAKIVADGNRLTVSGALDNGLKYEWQLLVISTAVR